MPICCFLHYIPNITNNNAYMCYRIYRQILEEQGASDDVDSRLVAEFPTWFKSHVCDYHILVLLGRSLAELYNNLVVMLVLCLCADQGAT
jgi:hypothetical protein